MPQCVTDFRRFVIEPLQNKQPLSNSCIYMRRRNPSAVVDLLDALIYNEEVSNLTIGGGYKSFSEREVLALVNVINNNKFLSKLRVDARIHRKYHGLIIEALKSNTVLWEARFESASFGFSGLEDLFDVNCTIYQFGFDGSSTSTYDRSFVYKALRRNYRLSPAIVLYRYRKQKTIPYDLERLILEFRVPRSPFW